MGPLKEECAEAQGYGVCRLAGEKAGSSQSISRLPSCHVAVIGEEER